MNTFTKWIQSAHRDEEGASMVEYGLLVFFIALAVMAILAVLGPTIADMFDQVNTGITSSTTTG